MWTDAKNTPNVQKAVKESCENHKDKGGGKRRRGERKRGNTSRGPIRKQSWLTKNRSSACLAVKR